MRTKKSCPYYYQINHMLLSQLKETIIFWFNEHILSEKNSFVTQIADYHKYLVEFICLIKIQREASLSLIRTANIIQGQSITLTWQVINTLNNR